MKSGATETSYYYLQEHYQFPENVFVSHLPEELKKSNHLYKILWAHHAYDQPVFLNFDHNIVNHIVTPSQWNKDQFIKYLNVPECPGDAAADCGHGLLGMEDLAMARR